MKAVNRKNVISAVAALCCLVASSASAQSYNEKTEGVFTFRAYQPQLVGGYVEVMGVALSSTSQGTNWCTYLYKNGVFQHGKCNTVSGSNSPDVLIDDSYCNPGFTITWETRVRRGSGSTLEVRSPVLVTQC